MQKEIDITTICNEFLTCYYLLVSISLKSVKLVRMVSTGNKSGFTQLRFNSYPDSTPRRIFMIILFEILL